MRNGVLNTGEDSLGIFNTQGLASNVASYTISQPIYLLLGEIYFERSINK